MFSDTRHLRDRPESAGRRVFRHHGNRSPRHCAPCTCFLDRGAADYGIDHYLSLL